MKTTEEIINVKFSDSKEELITLFKHVKNYGLKPLFLLPRQISELEYLEIKEYSKLTNDGLMTYDKFFEKYWNYREIY